MSQSWHFNGSDAGENQQGDYAAASPCSVLELSYPFVDPAMLAQKIDGESHIVLTCGPQDDDEDDE